MRESTIEKRVSASATKCGWLVFKWSSPNNKGVPDRIFVRGGVVVFVEFKAPGKKPTKLQQHMHEKLIQEGMQVHVIDDIATGEALFA